MPGKISPTLAEKFNQLPPEEPVDVVDELGGDAMEALDNASSVDQMRQVFAGHSQPVKDKIKSMGGDVIGEAWLNGTLQAKLTRRAAESLYDEPAVARVD